MKNKILIYSNLIPPDYGGSYLRIYRLAKRLNDDGLLYRIVTLTKKNKYVKFNENLIEITKIIFLQDVFIGQLKLLSVFFKNYKEFSTVYIVSIQWHSFVLVLLAKIFQKKIIIGVTLSMVDSPASTSKNLLTSLYYNIKNLQFKLAHHIIVNSPLLYKECLEAGVHERKLKMIPNPIDQNVFFKLDKVAKDNLKRSLNMNQQSTNILFVGALNKRKGVDTLLQICTQLNQMNVKYSLNIIGKVEGVEIDKNFVKQIRKNIFLFNNASVSKINLLGVKKNVNEYMQASDFFVFPSRNEGLPNVVIEAMACGLPIACSHLPGITDYLLNPSCLAPPDDYLRFADIITNMLANKDLINQHTQDNMDFVNKYLGTKNNLTIFKSLIFKS